MLITVIVVVVVERKITGGQIDAVIEIRALIRRNIRIDAVDRLLADLIEIPLEVAAGNAGLSMCMARTVRTVESMGGKRPCVAAAIVDCERLADDPRRI